MLIKNNAPRVHNVAGTILYPGVNQVDEVVWKKACDILIVKHYVKTKELEAVAAENDIAAMKIGDAVKLIGDTYNRELLKQWGDTDTRGRVNRAIAEQLELIEKAGKPPAEE